MHRPNRSPAQRFRIEQFLPYLKNDNIHTCLNWILNEREDRYFYNGNIVQKLYVFLSSTFKLFKIVFFLPNNSVVFIQREVYFLGTSFFEKWIARKAKIIYDFDDSIWLPNISASNKKYSFLKNPNKTNEIIRLADIVIAGNQFLANYAMQYNQKVVVIPTVLNTDLYKPLLKSDESKIVIGWSGSHSTIEHFKLAIPFLVKIKQKYGDRIKFKVMGDINFSCPELDIQGIPWTENKEIEIINSFDIGIMPLPDNAWARGKCGFKGLQYMSLEIPTIMSPVGVNAEIIQDGINGLLANADEEWIDKISSLIEDIELRRKIGKAGRKKVLENYSVKVWSEVFKKTIQSGIII